MKLVTEDFFFPVFIQRDFQNINEILLILNFEKVPFRDPKNDSDFRCQSPKILIIDVPQGPRVEMCPKVIDAQQLESVNGPLFGVEDLSVGHDDRDDKEVQDDEGKE